MTQQPDFQQPDFQQPQPPQQSQGFSQPHEGSPDHTAPLSGLRNPAAAVRGIGMATLLLETLVLLLALQPMLQLSAVPGPVALTVVGALALLTVLTASTLRHAWGWKLGLIVQLGVVAAGFVHLALLVLGLVFLAIWVYVLRVRRTVLGPRA